MSLITSLEIRVAIKLLQGLKGKIFQICSSFSEKKLDEKLPKHGTEFLQVCNNYMCRDFMPGLSGYCSCFIYRVKLFDYAKDMGDLVRAGESQIDGKVQR